MRSLDDRTVVSPARPPGENRDVDEGGATDPMGVLTDGTPYHAPLGQLAIVDDGTRVVCHLCGEHLQLLSTSHLRRHGWQPDEYREAFGLGRSVGLCAPTVSERRRELGADRYRRNPGTRAGMQRGQDLARSGELLQMSHDVQRPGSARLQRRRQIAAVTAPQRTATRAQAESRRLERVRDLGFTDMRGYLLDRYMTQHWPVARIKAELQIGSAVLVEILDKAKIERRRPGGAAPARVRWDRATASARPSAGRAAR